MKPENESIIRGVLTELYYMQETLKHLDNMLKASYPIDLITRMQKTVNNLVKLNNPSMDIIQLQKDLDHVLESGCMNEPRLEIQKARDYLGKAITESTYEQERRNVIAALDELNHAQGTIEFILYNTLGVAIDANVTFIQNIFVTIKELHLVLETLKQ